MSHAHLLGERVLHAYQSASTSITMVIPKHHKDDWLPVLQAAGHWSPPLSRTLVIAPHPDDESLACAGLIAALRAAGVEVIVVAATDGENAYTDGLPLGSRRQHEQECALEVLGVPAAKITRFHLPDSGLQSVERRMADLLLPLVDDHTHIVAPWTRDFHPDHEVCGRVAQEVAARVGALLSFYLFWTFHRGAPSLLNAERLVSIPLTESQQHQKMQAVRCHESQLWHASGDPILPDDLLWPARLPFEAYILP